MRVFLLPDIEDLVLLGLLVVLVDSEITDRMPANLDLHAVIKSGLYIPVLPVFSHRFHLSLILYSPSISINIDPSCPLLFLLIGWSLSSFMRTRGQSWALTNIGSGIYLSSVFASLFSRSSFSPFLWYFFSLCSICLFLLSLPLLYLLIFVSVSSFLLILLSTFSGGFSYLYSSLLLLFWLLHR